MSTWPAFITGTTSSEGVARMSEPRLRWLCGLWQPEPSDICRGRWSDAGEKVGEAITRFTPDEPKMFERLLNQIAYHPEPRARESDDAV